MNSGEAFGGNPTNVENTYNPPDTEAVVTNADEPAYSFSETSDKAAGYSPGEEERHLYILVDIHFFHLKLVWVSGYGSPAKVFSQCPIGLSCVAESACGEGSSAGLQERVANVS